MNKSVNPFANRWALLGLVAVFLLLVTELVGTDESGGVLSQLAGSRSADVNSESAPSVEVIEADPPAGVEEEEVPEEDQPQIISAEQAEDDSDFQPDGDADVSDQSDGGGEVEVIEPAEEVELLDS